MNIPAFIAAAESYAGTPFLHQGRLPGVGLDCAGVVVCALQQVGHPVTDAPPGYGRLPNQGMLERTVAETCDKVAASALQDGDVLMFRFTKEPQHLAVYAAGRLIHAWQDIGRVVVHDFDKVWRRRMVAAYRVRD